jgi:periplasmic protein TonB
MELSRLPIRASSKALRKHCQPAGMDSPALGFRRATVTSWALVGIGIAGVAGATTLAYADTVKPPKEAPVDVAVPAPVELIPPLAEDPSPTPLVETSTEEPPPPPPETTPETTTAEAPAPVTEYTPTYTPTYTSTQEATSAPPTTTRRTHTPTTRVAPNYSPPHSVSRGS